MSCAITGEPLSAPIGYRMPTLPEPLGRSHAPWPRGHRRRLGRGPLAARGQTLRADAQRAGGPAPASFARSASAWLMHEVK